MKTESQVDNITIGGISIQPLQVFLFSSKHFIKQHTLPAWVSFQLPYEPERFVEEGPILL